jgi:hypothetical protein
VSLYAKGTGTIAITAQGTGFFTPLNITLTSTWTRYTLTIQPSGAISSFTFYVSNFTGSTATSVDIAFPQAELGDIATDYIPTTTAAVSVGMTADVPRLDYLGSSCPSLLLEPQRTNLAQFSEQFDNAAWTKISSSVTANTTISPDGYTNADTIAFTAATDARCERAIGGAYESQSHTVSVYAKVASGTSTFRLKCTHASVVDYFSSDFTATTEWQRFIFTATFDATVGTGLVYGVINGTDAVAKNVIFYGFQTEINASYATSYIPTLATSVTRVADAASKTGISSLIGQTEGTLFFEFNSKQLTGSQEFIGINDGTEDNRIIIFTQVNNSLILQVRASGVAGVSIQTPTLIENTNYKVAVAYKENDVSFYMNGTQIGTDNSTLIPLCSVFSLDDGDNARNFFKPLKQAILFKTRLSNTELAQLTTI